MIGKLKSCLYSLKEEQEDPKMTMLLHYNVGLNSNNNDENEDQMNTTWITIKQIVTFLQSCLHFFNIKGMF